MLRAKNLLVVALLASAASCAFALTPKETLKATFSDSSSPGALASCAALSCVASPVTIYGEVIECPADVGRTCTFDIQIAGTVESGGNSITAGEHGFYQFLVDGAIPNGGGTDASGFYTWQKFGPEFLFGTSYNVHTTVKNSVLNEAHVIEVNLSCQEVIGDTLGCFAKSGFQTLVVRVWTP